MSWGIFKKIVLFFRVEKDNDEQTKQLKMNLQALSLSTPDQSFRIYEMQHALNRNRTSFS